MCLPPCPASGSGPPSLCRRITSSASPGRQDAEPRPGPARCSQAADDQARRDLPVAPRGRAAAAGPGCWARGPRSPEPVPAPAPVRAGARRPPASGTDQAACERWDSCSGLKYAGYFYLPTSGGEGHPTSGRGGCYTMFPFSREGKWREARLPDHMVLKSMKKN